MAQYPSSGCHIIDAIKILMRILHGQVLSLLRGRIPSTLAQSLKGEA